MGKRKNELEKTEESTTALAVADGAMEVGMMDDASPDDLFFPRLHLWQGTGEEDKKYGAEHPKGTLLNTSTSEALATDRFIPIRGWHEWIEWQDRDQGGGILRRSRDKNDFQPSDFEWGANGEPPIAQHYIIWLCLFGDEELPFTVGFTKSALNNGRLLATLAAKGDWPFACPIRR